MLTAKEFTLEKIMVGSERRQAIIERLIESEKPLSGGYLAKQFGISRQVVVQDIALLRAEGHDILAAARGYILNKDQGVMKSRVMLVKHDRGQLQQELNIVVDNGGRVRDVIISHGIYGELTGDLMLSTRREVQQFVDTIDEKELNPLMHLTGGIHMHTIEAVDEETLDIIEEELKVVGFFVGGIMHD